LTILGLCSLLRFFQRLGLYNFFSFNLSFGVFFSPLFNNLSLQNHPTKSINMAVSAKVLLMTAFVSLVNGHAQILNVQGIAGSPASVGFQGKLHHTAPFVRGQQMLTPVTS
jgi:hypothetical protein